MQKLRSVNITFIASLGIIIPIKSVQTLADAQYIGKMKKKDNMALS